jgi:uncharacterized protein YndB with AHSA1/START domain
MEPLRLRFTVDCPPARAFALWAERTALWWPPDHSVSGAPELVAFEPNPGGRVYEREPGGAEHEWGQVLDWEPPRRLRYTWHLRADPADATEVEIRFEPTDDGTLVTVEHSGWERLGARAAERRERNERSWAGLLPHYVAACQLL